MAECFGNRVEIANPGEPVVPVERFIDGYQSRNERLADLMRRMGICEEKSRGSTRSFAPWRRTSCRLRDSGRATVGRS